jgi:hypothetical protein
MENPVILLSKTLKGTERCGAATSSEEEMNLA